MCTVTFLATPDSGYILTSNRDEMVSREKAIFPFQQDGYHYPQDGRAGGTWIITTAKGNTYCLLNGAFVKHISMPPYRISRGQVVLDIARSHGSTEFVKKYNFEGIEPFTLIAVERENSTIMLSEIRWDGTRIFLSSLDSQQPHFWCSATLYSKKVALKREAWFTNWLISSEQNQNEILKFHQFGGEGDTQIDINVDRGGILRTVSITSIAFDTKSHVMRYLDLLSNSDVSQTINQ